MAPLLALCRAAVAAPPPAPAFPPVQEAPNLCQSATDITGSYDKTTGYELSRAFDNDFATRWDARNKDGAAWIEITWPKPVTFNRVVVYEWNSHLHRLALQVPDGQGGWTEKASVPRASGGDPVVNATEIHLPTPLTTDHARLLLDGSYISLFEVRIANATFGEVQGKVTDKASGRPVARARVRVVPSAETVTTDATGVYHLSLEPGTYSLEAEKPIGADNSGFDALSADKIRVDAAKPSVHDFALYPIHGERRVLEGVIPASKFPVDKTSTIAVPLDVPPGVQRLTLNLEDVQPTVGGPRQGNAIDFFFHWLSLALFDTKGVGSQGFRGLGMSRNSNTAMLSPDKATPGWLPGPLTPGHWTLLFYTATNDVDMRYRLTATFQFGGAPPGRAPAIYEPGVLAPGPAWFRGDFHNHSTHSADASESLERLMNDRRASGWDFLALTDHNTISGHSDAARLAGKQRPLVLLGQEVTTEYGHFNAWGLPVGWWSDFRIQPGDDSLDKLIAAVHAAGGQIMMNHPGYPKMPPVGFSWNPNLDGMEVWNGVEDKGLHDRLAYADSFLSQGKIIRFLGGSDMHHPAQAHTPITWVYAENLSRPALLAAIARGHTILSRTFEGPFLFLEADPKGDSRFTAMVGDTVTAPSETTAISFRVTARGGAGKTLRIVTAHGVAKTVPVPEGASFQTTFRLSPAETSFVRLELVESPPAQAAPADADLPHYLAITNPIFLRIGTTR